MAMSMYCCICICEFGDKMVRAIYSISEGIFQPFSSDLCMSYVIEPNFLNCATLSMLGCPV